VAASCGYFRAVLLAGAHSLAASLVDPIDVDDDCKLPLFLLLCESLAALATSGVPEGGSAKLCFDGGEASRDMPGKKEYGSGSGGSCPTKRHPTSE
jgi:hypothetical protein